MQYLLSLLEQPEEGRHGTHVERVCPDRHGVVHKTRDLPEQRCERERREALFVHWARGKTDMSFFNALKGNKDGCLTTSTSPSRAGVGEVCVQAPGACVRYACGAPVCVRVWYACSAVLNQ